MADDQPRKTQGSCCKKESDSPGEKEESRNRPQCTQELEYYMRKAASQIRGERRNNLTNDAKTLG